MFVHGDNSARQEKRGLLTKKVALGRTLREQDGDIAGRLRTSTAASTDNLFDMLENLSETRAPAAQA